MRSYLIMYVLQRIKDKKNVIVASFKNWLKNRNTHTVFLVSSFTIAELSYCAIKIYFDLFHTPPASPWEYMCALSLITYSYILWMAMLAEAAVVGEHVRGIDNQR